MRTITLSVAPVLAGEMGGTSRVELQANTVLEALMALEARYPQLGIWLWQKSGQINPALAVFVNNQNIQQTQTLQTPLKNGDNIMLVSALEGG